MSKFTALIMCILAAVYLCAGILAQPVAQDLAQSQAQAIQDYERHVQQLQQALQFLSREIQHAKKRSGCFLNGGMAHNCDLKDVVSAVDEAKYWGSYLSPGKRRWGALTPPASDLEFVQSE
ncbi:uncharacterized protein LOC132204440 [Neocloeon triangulifer]|uniref:uncharacterized protein LOC132204440 n=1 Tax=Neocloeon triangulifer TaxID=2078957 RepID=UPI00286F0F79|nr:uncharacterized protein LOC132204440 [Neocloeon triangulifer]XP_059488923.1 uncharacterized protein LOC132204440 [Neocloeon triangulifer]